MRGRVAPPLLSSLLVLCLIAPAGAVEPDARGGGSATPDADGQYIVVLDQGADPAPVIERAAERDGVSADRTYRRAIRGFTATLDAEQRLGLLADPSVAAVVPDERIELASLQVTPTSISRIGATRSALASIDGADQRVDSDVAILDTGISIHPDLNVVGGYNCATSNRTAWRDLEGHGTHVAGTVAALDNDYGVVGVAPGARLHAVRILNDDGEGLLSWYICGLDWVLAQRDPIDPSRPLFEAVNMSVTKTGTDDRNCGFTNKDPLHQAICRVVAGGITVVASAANSSRSASGNVPGAYDEVITVSALADTDGLAGGLGGNACRSFGGYDRDDTFADFSNYGGDVDIIAPGKCIFSTFRGSIYATLTGTSMSTPAVTGAAALYKSSRPNATPGEVREALRYLGTLDWNVSTDPDAAHEPLLDVSHMGPLGAFALAAAGSPAPIEAGTPVSVPITVTRDATFFERVSLSASAPPGWAAVFDHPSLFGWQATAAILTVTPPPGTVAGRYDIAVNATNQGRIQSTSLAVEIFADLPVAAPPVASIQPSVAAAANAATVQVRWPDATDPSSPIAGYELEISRDGGPWGQTIASGAGQAAASYALEVKASYGFRVRAMDRGGNWSPWVESTAPTRVLSVDDRRSAITYRGAWQRTAERNAMSRTLTASRQAGASARLSFTGRGVAIVAPRTRYRGIAEVYVDGVLAKRVGLWSSVSAHRQVVFARSFPETGAHTIEWRVVGTGRYPLVELDSFLFLR
jgi:subtilisin family serine protease